MYQPDLLKLSGSNIVLVLAPSDPAEESFDKAKCLELRLTRSSLTQGLRADPAALKLIHLGGVKLIHPKLDHQTTAS